MWTRTAARLSASTSLSTCASTPAMAFPADPDIARPLSLHARSRGILLHQVEMHNLPLEVSTRRRRADRVADVGRQSLNPAAQPLSGVRSARGLSGRISLDSSCPK